MSISKPTGMKLSFPAQTIFESVSMYLESKVASQSVLAQKEKSRFSRFEFLPVSELAIHLTSFFQTL